MAECRKYVKGGVSGGGEIGGELAREGGEEMGQLRAIAVGDKKRIGERRWRRREPEEG